MFLNESPEDPGRIVILGAGNWGTTLACLYGEDREVLLVAHTPEHARQIETDGQNKRYLPGVELPDHITVISSEHFTPEPGDILIAAVPSHQIRTAIAAHASELGGTLIVNAAKGFEHKTLRTMSEVLIDLLPHSDVISLSGPNIAREIAAGLPTRAVLAGKRLEALSRASKLLQHPSLVFETSRDLRGVELAASLKGILAIAIGMADGFHLGDNFTGLLMTYGLREFTELATFMGAKHETVYGIAGLGDMVTSSLSPSGRNRQFGRLIASGQSPRKALDEVGMVVEGFEMLRTIGRLEELNLPLPLFSTVRDIIERNGKEAKALLLDAVMHYGSVKRNESFAFRSQQSSSQNADLPALHHAGS
jgi:glycerol-3-phosphate dehydrogenase (NAD(P)+)